MATPLLPSLTPALEPLEAGLVAQRRYLLLSRPQHCVRIAILDDHPVTTLGLASYLGGNSDLEVRHAEVSGPRLLDKLRESPCDAAIVDFYLPEQPWDGMDYIRRLRRQHPEMAIVTFSADKTPDTRYAAFRAGANGYLSKSCPVDMIPDMLRATVADRRNFYIGDAAGIRPARPQPPASLLTTSETEILRHIAQGFSVTQISQRLLRSKKTVSSHKRRAMRKLGLADDLGLALYLKENFAPHAGR
ncbi:response regulator transcription factor [Bordetella sp. 2513F-2]